MPDSPTRTLPPDPDETHALDGPADPALPPSPAERYELQTPIARGGMGEVLAARDHALGREVAVKVLRADLAHRPAVAARFVEEARLTSQLQHPNVPPVHDLGTLPDGRPFLAMKLVKGRTLADLLARDPPDLPALLAVLEQVCQAVAFAHARGVIHRDLKPANVMVGKFNDVQVMDWGLAKVLASRGCQPPESEPDPADGAAAVSVIPSDRDGSSLTQAGSVLGTPAYMPPEQAKGDIAGTDARADVFALGAILCELLTGKPPYAGATGAEVQALALTAQLGPALDRLAACGADAELVVLARQCLAADPAGRPADAGAVARAVAAYRAGVAERLRAAELAGARAEERRKRARVQLALVAAVGLLLAAGGAVAWHLDRQATEQATVRERERERARTLAAAALDEAERALRADELGAATTALDRADERLAEDRTADLDARYQSLVRDRDMVRTLAYLSDEQGTGAGVPGGGGYFRVYPDAFRRYGVDLDAGDPAVVAGAVTRSPIRGQLLGGLYIALSRKLTFRSAPVLAEVLRRVDDNPARNAIRGAVLARDGPRVRALVRALDPADLTPEFAVFMNGEGLSDKESRRVLTLAWERNPGNFALNQELASFYGSPVDDVAAAVGYARTMVSLRPASPVAFQDLAHALEEAGRYDEAIAAVRTYAALRREPGWQIPRHWIGLLIEKRSGKDAADSYLRAELAAAPNDAEAHGALGLHLYEQKEFAAALPVLRRARELDPTRFRYVYPLLKCLERQGDADGALVVMRRAGEVAQPRLSANMYLAEMLIDRHRYAEALRVCDRMAEENPDVAKAPFLQLRATTARAAFLAGTAGGTDPAPPAARAALRGRALALLREEVALLRIEGSFNPERYQTLVINRLDARLSEPAFAAVRDPAARATLPAEEAVAWAAFWDELRAFRAALAPPVAPPPRPVVRP